MINMINMINMIIMLNIKIYIYTCIYLYYTMNIINILKLFILTGSLSSNNSLKICKDCKYFIENKECKKFSETDLVTGSKTYEYAKNMRNDITKCGMEAKYFEKNNYKIITEPYYYMKENIWLLPSLLLLLSEIYAIYKQKTT